MVQTWQSVKVTDESLESFGRVGTARSAGPYDSAPEKKGDPVVKMLDVQLDGDDEPTAFELAQLTPL